ncbi:MAG: DUF4199 domain-containing protein [Bacteroidetes bacterium]|nr:DUF4199 domain-containing protein [Bacteroidota bacterium]MBS1630923.1 DUF4199 domain-containing protein [Bacteroidota bacterium]
MKKQKQTHIMYGFLTSLALIILFVAFEVTGLSEHKGVQFIGWAVMLAGLILNAFAFTKANQAEVTFGQVFGSCFKATAIITIVMVIWSMLMFQIFPGMEPKMLDKAREGMSAQKGMTDEQIEKGMAMTQKYFKVFIAAGALFGTLIEGLIFSLIAAAIAKKKPKPAQGTH